MRTPNTKSIADAALGLALIVAVALGCGKFRKGQSSRTTQPLQTFQELKTGGTITSADTGGTCAKNFNGQMMRSPQVGFSYSVDGKNYTSVGCTYNPQTAVGAKINVCYNSSSPMNAKPCSE